ncbi:hypothetical protein [Gorillibacterium sp. sgz500922]|uniref:hypothetical protein n=1 Tax=Gorillibacterium sp. sgz500922 TaxID=3446694 RepID=UPI003F666C31
MIPLRVEEYVTRVINRLRVNEGTRERIRRDLTASILERSERVGIDKALGEMGTPEEVARDFTDNLAAGRSTDDLAERMRELTRELTAVRPYFEYRSERSLFGMPLVHIKLRRWGYGLFRPYAAPAVAKGVFAVGDIAFGIVACGALSAGVIAVGAVSAGLAAVGAIALGLALGLGAVATGAVAAGAVAVGGLTFGAVAVGRLAIGSLPVGHVTRTISDTAEPLTRAEFRELLRHAFPAWFK